MPYILPCCVWVKCSFRVNSPKIYSPERHNYDGTGHKRKIEVRRREGRRATAPVSRTGATEAMLLLDKSSLASRWPGIDTARDRLEQGEALAAVDGEGARPVHLRDGHAPCLRGEED